MVQDIMREEAFLAQKAEPATSEDLDTARDLLNTLAAHMIGVNRRIIVFDGGGAYMVMFNPEIIRKSGPYEAEEGCLSLTGTRKAKRWQSIKVHTKMRSSRPASRPSPAGRRRLFSTRSTTVMGY